MYRRGWRVISFCADTPTHSLHLFGHAYCGFSGSVTLLICSSSTPRKNWINYYLSPTNMSSSLEVYSFRELKSNGMNSHLVAHDVLWSLWSPSDNWLTWLPPDEPCQLWQPRPAKCSNSYAIYTLVCLVQVHLTGHQSSLLGLPRLPSWEQDFKMTSLVHTVGAGRWLWVVADKSCF